MRAIRPLLSVPALAAGLACGTPTAPDPVGSWGGPHLLLILTPTGGTAEYDCAHGAVTEPVRVDGEGRFEAAGTFVREHGGPIRNDETLPTYPARYAGRIIGDVMTLAVTRTDSAIAIGAFSLERGRTGAVFKCL
ncbi:MAG TPA: hypothetical protein VJL28_00195 [Gemmatimonadaceae bacterium]|nr:hypothetical protein [Gemmatimonadaceae bacterium]